MRAMTYVMLGIVGTIAYQKIQNNSDMLTKEMQKMMQNNNKSIRKIKEIF